jgi:uncharacterized damage-inducible protein DinB
MDKRYLLLLDALQGTHRDLRRLVRPLREDDALQRPAQGEWHIKDIIAHLGNIEPRFRARLQRIVSEDNPQVASMGPDESAHHVQQPVAALIDAFAAERDSTVAWLGTLTQAQWLRVCTHESFGVTRLRKHVEILIGHDNEHLAQIVTVREFLDKSKK